MNRVDLQLSRQKKIDTNVIENIQVMKIGSAKFYLSD